jgi:alpha-ketoglutaric semialdehyde dehydrogenase
MTHIVQNRIGGALRDASDGATFERATRPTAPRWSRSPRSRPPPTSPTRSPPRRRRRAWKRTTPTQRADMLTKAGRGARRAGGEIAAEMTAEEGKPLADARMEANRTPKNLELYAGEAYRLTGSTFPSDDTPLVYSVLDPVGVVGVITPWNFPLNLASRKIGPALAAGNTVVFKPSPMSPLMGDRLAEAFEEAGLPAGVLNVVHGFAPAPTSCRRPGRRGHVHRFERRGAEDPRRDVGLGRRLQLELGGKNPVSCSPTPTSTPQPTGGGAVELRRLAGQACTGAGRILVHEASTTSCSSGWSPRRARYVVGPGARRRDDGPAGRRLGGRRMQSGGRARPSPTAPGRVRRRAACDGELSARVRSSRPPC